MNIDIVSWKATTILLTGTSWNADPISIINSPTDSVMFVKWSLNIHRIHLKNNHGVDTLSSEISALTKSPCSRSWHELTVKLTSKTRLLNHDLICWQKNPTGHTEKPTEWPSAHICHKTICSKMLALMTNGQSVVMSVSKSKWIYIR